MFFAKKPKMATEKLILQNAATDWKSLKMLK